MVVVRVGDEAGEEVKEGEGVIRTVLLYTVKWSAVMVFGQASVERDSREGEGAVWRAVDGWW